MRCPPSSFRATQGRGVYPNVIVDRRVPYHSLCSTRMSSASASNSSPTSKYRQRVRPLTLSVDIGGSRIKAQIVNGRGRPVGEHLSVATPPKLSPSKLLRAVASLVTPIA